jgi:hypothetical protein
VKVFGNAHGQKELLRLVHYRIGWYNPLGDAPKGIELIREYMPRLLPLGRVVISKYVIGLAGAQARAERSLMRSRRLNRCL